MKDTDECSYFADYFLREDRHSSVVYYIFLLRSIVIVWVDSQMRLEISRQALHLFQKRNN